MNPIVIIGGGHAAAALCAALAEAGLGSRVHLVCAEPQLPYQPQTETIETTSVIRQITGVGSEVDYEQLAKSLAVALILLLAGAHLRRFLAIRED